MKAAANFIILILFTAYFFSCKKELSFEGYLVKDTAGNCLPVIINSIFKQGVPLTDTNYIDVTVEVTTAGNYSIFTDTLNGIYFNAASRFTTGGRKTVRLVGHGIPLTAGVFSFTVHYNNNVSSCMVQITVAPPGPTGAVFTIDCDPVSTLVPHAYGMYVAGYPLNDSDKLVVFAHVNSVGAYALSTTTVNGFSFNASGTFTITGGQYITLTGSGTPINAGTTTLSVSGAAVVSCDFSITVNPRDESSKMYYMVHQPNGSYEIYSAYADGTNEQKLTNFSNNGTLQKLVFQHSFNQDSTKLIFVVAKDNFGGDLMIMNVNGSNAMPLAPGLGSKIHDPYVFQNGQKLLFWVDTSAVLNGGYPGQIFTANIDGTNLVKLTSVAAGNGLPDGSCAWPVNIKTNNTILYAGFGVTNALYNMNTDGTNKHVIALGSGNEFSHPQPSPDGTKIVYSKQLNVFTNNGMEIFIMNADGTNAIQLTNFSNNFTLPVFSELPVFSKDGKSIYFDCNESGVFQIYKMNINGTNKIKITNGMVERRRPLVN